MRAGSHGTHIIAYRPKACASLTMSSLNERARANRSSVSGCVQPHAPHVRHLASKLWCDQKMHKKRSEACAYYLCGAHHANPLSGISQISVLSKLGAQSAWCTPRKSHVELPAQEFSEMLHTICAVLTTRLKFEWCTPHRFHACGVCAVLTTQIELRVAFARCTPHRLHLCGVHRVSLIRAVYTT